MLSEGVRMNWMGEVQANLFSECLELHIRSVLFVQEMYLLSVLVDIVYAS